MHLRWHSFVHGGLRWLDLRAYGLGEKEDGAVGQGPTCKEVLAASLWRLAYMAYGYTSFGS